MTEIVPSNTQTMRLVWMEAERSLFRSILAVRENYNEKPLYYFSEDQREEADRICQLMNELSRNEGGDPDDDEYEVAEIQLNSIAGAIIQTRYYCSIYDQSHVQLELWKLEKDPQVELYLEFSEEKRLFPPSDGSGIQWFRDSMVSAFSKEAIVDALRERFTQKMVIVANTSEGGNFKMDIVEYLN